MSAIQATLNSFIPVFTSNFEIAYQQMESKLRSAVNTEPGEGERMQGRILQSQELIEYTERGGDTNYTDVDADFWNVFPQPADLANLLDEHDEAYLAKVSLPTSELMQGHAAAASRQVDNKIVRAATAAAFRGRTGTTSSSFDTTNQRVAVDYDGSGALSTTANVGLNYYKIARARRILDDNEVPENDRYLVIRAAQMEDLAVDVLDRHSANVSDLSVLPGTRTIQNIMGFTVIQVQRVLVGDTVTSAGTDVASCLAFQKMAIKARVWKDKEVHLDVLPLKRHAVGIRTVINVGATRARDEAVVEILCDQSPA